MALSSFIDPGRLRMQVIVRAPSPGQAIATAQHYRVWLLEHHHWGTEAARLDVIEAGPSGTAPPPSR